MQKRVSIKSYLEVLERIQQKLQGWKVMCLSLATRVTLIKAVTSSIPTYVMQTLTLPKCLCGKIDRCQRQFLWGSTKDHKRIHKVQWDNVCKAKHEEGLGIRQMKPFNNAMLAKQAWRVITKEDNLSTKFLEPNMCVQSQHPQAWL